MLRVEPPRRVVRAGGPEFAVQDKMLARERRQPLRRLVVKELLQHPHQDREKEPALCRLDLELGALLCASHEHGDCQRVDRAIHAQSAFARFHHDLELAAGRSGVAEGPAKDPEKFPKAVARQILQDAQARNVHPIWAQS